jgi:uncharacterized protein
MRNLIRLLLLLLFGLSARTLCAEAAASLAAPTAYVDDYASVLSAAAKAQLEAECVEVHNKTKAQIFIVTVDSLDGTSIEQFSNDLFHKWKIGEKKTDRGILMVFAIKDHKRRIEVGYGLEPILNDAKVGDIGRSMVPELRAADYDSAIKTGLNGVAQVIADDSKVELVSLEPASNASEDQAAPAPVEAAPQSSQLGYNPIGLVVFLILFVAIIAFVIISIIRSAGRGGTGSSFGTSTFSSSDSSFSNSDSGSSSSSESFSGGDGGDSGGGGASGDW